MVMDALIVTIVGALVGFGLAKRIMRGPGVGLVGNMILGSIGALLVRFGLWPLGFKVGDSIIGSSISAAVGYVLRAVGLPVAEEFITLVIAGFGGAAIMLMLVGRLVKR